ncbi:hypothetical protein [Romboutsia weinsteinii]|nr:hypothetical protein [Romboutsia weinsteinii]
MALASILNYQGRLPLQTDKNMRYSFLKYEKAYKLDNKEHIYRGTD